MPQPSRRAFRPSNFTRSWGLRSFQALLLNLNDELAFVLAWVMQLSDSPEEQHFSFGGKYPPITPETRLLSANYVPIQIITSCVLEFFFLLD